MTVSAPPVKGTEFEVDDVYEARVRFVRFRCDRESDEAGDDEPYWASGAAGDNKAEIVVCTPQFTSVSTGTVRDFQPNTYWFKGAAEAFVAGNIQVWEADHSPQSHYDEVRQTLGAIASAFAEAAMTDGPGWDAVFQGMVALAAGFVNWLLGLNKDDFIAEKTIAYSRDALARMAGTNGGLSTLVFDGGSSQGKHTLTLQVSFGPVIAAALSHSIYHAGRWSTPVHIPHLVAATRPAMFVHNGNLYAVYKAADDSILITCYTGGSWSQPLTVRDAAGQVVRSNAGMTAGSHGTEMVLVWNGNTGIVNPDTGRVIRHWTHSALVGRPALATLNGELYLFWPSEHYVGVLQRDGDRWNTLTFGDIRPFPSAAGVTAVTYKGRIWAFIRGQDRSGMPVTLAKSCSDPKALPAYWRDEQAPSGVSSIGIPAPTVARLGLGEGSDEFLYVATHPAESWGGPPVQTAVCTEQTRTHLHSTTLPENIRNDLSICAHLGTIHLLYW
ncbi:hypothetical protein AB0K89_22950 [Streptomyces cinnamoneus]|uniref:hypothetical protein n=1 Tax=Streptomyces cinnamoneus TaxID=53446 RepID=UPI003435BE4B